MTGRWGAGAVVVLALMACAPRVEVRTQGEPGQILFRVRSPAQRATLSGTMTGWRAWPLQRRGRAFELALELPPGRYEYRLETVDAAGARAVFPEGVERAPDGFGGENAVLRVR